MKQIEVQIMGQSYLLGCPEGRSSPEWIDFNFYGHQIVAHLAPGECGAAQRNAVDGHGVPVRLCKTCAGNRGLLDLPLISGVTIGTLAELADATLAADKVITF